MGLRAEDLRIQYLVNPVGLGTARPEFSYVLISEERGEVQTAYQILAASEEELLKEGKADLWDSGKRSGSTHSAILYGGKELCSRQRVFWKVRVWNRQDMVSKWSAAGKFEIGLLSEKDWKGCWIGQGDDFAGDKNTAPAFAGIFNIQDAEQVIRARLYISGLGLFQASLNGETFTESFFEPGESEFNRRVFYRVFDITAFVKEGKNVLGVLLGNGQYSGFAVAPVMRYGDHTLCETHRYQKDDTIYLKDGICGNKKLIAQVELTRQDGSLEIAAATGISGDWRWNYSPIVFQNWYGGEDYDGIRAEQMAGWDSPSGSHEDWIPAVPMAPPKGELSAREYLPVQISETWPAKSVLPLPGGRWLVDMGKNSAGFVMLRLHKTEKYRGTKIELFPAEVLKEDGSGVDQASVTQSCNTLFSCFVKDSYKISGKGEEQWHPVFCYHGFQYVEVAGFPGIPVPENFCGCALRVANPKYSDFETDNETLNRINQITDRSIESNMMSSFTDCPQIEKLGWLETTHLMFASMASGYDIRSWIPKIVRDMQDAQVSKKETEENPMNGHPQDFPGFSFSDHKNRETEEIGFVPGIAPEYFRIGKLFKDPNWGGACIMTPWYYYWEYGDTEILRNAYPMMLGYLRHLEHASHNGILKDYAHMGEWGQIRENTPTTLVATCGFYLQAVTLSRIAGILGRREEQDYCEKLAVGIRKGFYEDRECRPEEADILGNDSQASYGCALFSGILYPEHREKAMQKLAAAVERSDWHLTSGEVGLKQVFYALAAGGRNDVIFRMVMNATPPSYRHFIEQRMTTLPEYWNYTELWNGLGRSRNHAMMGHVKEWLCRFVLGIRPVEPGYAKAEIHPYLGSGISFVRGSVFTVNGVIAVSCKRKNGRVEMEVSIPVGSEAELYIPYFDAEAPDTAVRLLEYQEGRTAMVRNADRKDHCFVLSGVPSGQYRWAAENL